MFKSCQQQKKEANTIVSPSNGTFISPTEVSDLIYSYGLVGKGFGVIPSTGIIKAPISGKVVVTSESKHIIGIRTQEEYYIFIYVGIETAKLAGQGFKYLITENQTVTKGEDLLRFDLNFIKEKVPNSLVLTMLTNIKEDDVLLGWHDNMELIAGETPVIDLIIR